MKADKLTIDVRARVTVDDLTAKACAKLLSIYMNDTGKKLMCTRKVDGTQELYFEGDEDGQQRS